MLLTFHTRQPQDITSGWLRVECNITEVPPTPSTLQLVEAVASNMQNTVIGTGGVLVQASVVTSGS